VEELEERSLLAVDVILEWNAVLLRANAVDHSGGTGRPEQGGPTLTARAFAIVSAAAYDAFNSVKRIGDPYLTLVPDATSASADAAVAQAARDTLAALYPSQRPTFDTALGRTLDRVPDGPAEHLGRFVGRTVAGRLLQARGNDNSGTINDPPYVPNGLPGFHDVDPLNPGQGFYAPDYTSVTPFALSSVNQIQARQLDDGTPQGRIDFLRSLEYTAAYYEVLVLGGDGVNTPTLRTAEQTEIGIFWGYDGSRGLGTPPRLYNQIVRTVAAQEGNTVAENARLFALVNLAMHDAGLVSWDAKYDNDFWRPILGIREGSSDGNLFTVGIPGWTPLGAPNSNAPPGSINFTPNFPAYTSGHATFGAATFKTLERFYGTDAIRFSFTSDEFNGITRDVNGQIRPVRTRTYDSFSQAAEENGQSRIYLGIHWHFDKTEGIRTGNETANFVFSNFLRPRGTTGTASVGTVLATPTTFTTTAVSSGTATEIAPGVLFTTVSVSQLSLASSAQVGSTGSGGLLILPRSTRLSGTDGTATLDTLPALQVSGTGQENTLATLERLFVTANPLETPL
jgi:hypothetical protein